MGVRILAGSFDGGPERAALVNSVTERPLALPMFEDREDAEAFLRWCSGVGYRGRSLERLNPAELDACHTRWLVITGRKAGEEGSTCNA
jgi:hypothetical protein